jgi:hypothetical protein
MARWLSKVGETLFRRPSPKGGERSADLGGLTYIGPDRVIGWVPDALFDRLDPVCIEVEMAGEPLIRLPINRSPDRPGQPRRFSITYPQSLRKGQIKKLSVRVEGEGPLRFSPVEYPPRYPEKPLSLDQISTPQDLSDAPPADRADEDGPDMSGDQRAWRRDGVLHLPGFLPEDLMEAYAQERWRLYPQLGSIPSPTVHMHVPECMALCLYPPLAERLEALFSEPMGLHLTLTGWESTERNWHQDAYLNPPEVGSWYVAVWMALEDIDPASGPFEYVPGSHRWPDLQRDLVLQQLGEGAGIRADWPELSERLLDPVYEAEIAKRGAEVVQYLPKKGDVLIWHARLLHRGSKPKVPGTPRRALIAHYSAISRRPDFPAAAQRPEGGFYFPVSVPRNL